MGKVKFEVVDGVLTVVDDAQSALPSVEESAGPESFSMDAQRVIHLKPDPKSKPQVKKPVQPTPNRDIDFSSGLGWIVAAILGGLWLAYIVVPKIVGG